MATLRAGTFLTLPMMCGIQGLTTVGGISNVVVWRSRVIVTGTFDKDTPLLNGIPVSDMSGKAHHILSWDGALLDSLGLGLDGPVRTLASLDNRLVAGGSFSKAFQSYASPLYLSSETSGVGGLVTWDGSRWELLGGAGVCGTVDMSLTVASSFYMAGSFWVLCHYRALGTVPLL